jgi:hypothetical protein
MTPAHPVVCPPDEGIVVWFGVDEGDSSCIECRDERMWPKMNRRAYSLVWGCSLGAYLAIETLAFSLHWSRWAWLPQLIAVAVATLIAITVRIVLIRRLSVRQPHDEGRSDP